MKGPVALNAEFYTLDIFDRKAPPALQFMANEILAELNDPAVQARFA
jgi:hypothetical protein